jgi:hypothetical protein
MHLKKNFSFGLLVMMLFMACSSPSKESKSGSPTPPVVPTVSPAGDSAGIGNAAKTMESGFDTLVNLELVEYCLPYPKGYKEDFKADVEKGHHIFHSPDKQTKIIMAGMFMGEEWDIIYHDVEAEVQEITMADPLHNMKTDEYFELSWQEDEKIIWMKKWHREDDGETVTVRFEYPESQSTAMKPIISVITSASTICK